MDKQIWYTPSEERPVTNGVQRIYRFEASPYHASVIQTNESHGGKCGLWELAVYRDGRMCGGMGEPHSPITADLDYDCVIGWLTEEEVQTYLARIDALQGVQR